MYTPFLVQVESLMLEVTCPACDTLANCMFCGNKTTITASGEVEGNKLNLIAKILTMAVLRLLFQIV